MVHIKPYAVNTQKWTYWGNCWIHKIT